MATRQIMLWVFLVLSALILASCSGATFTERYEQTPLVAKSSMRQKTVGEGRSTFTFNWRGERFICEKRSDGKFYIIGKETSPALLVPQNRSK